MASCYFFGSEAGEAVGTLVCKHAFVECVFELVHVLLGVNLVVEELFGCFKGFATHFLD